MPTVNFNQPKLLRYTSTNGKKISRSLQHHDLWLVTTADGLGWYSLQANETAMVLRNPIDQRLNVLYV